MSSEKGVSVKTERMFVLFVDISEWSKNDASAQKAQIVALCQAAKEVFSTSKLTPQWKVGTGDGFAVAFPATSSPLVIQTACSLFEIIQEQREFKIRMSLTEGSVVFYDNPLITRGKDLVGPAVIGAKRLLDGAASGSFLIEEHLANDVIVVDASWKQRLVKHSSVIDKHKNDHRTYRYIPDSEINKPHGNFITNASTTNPSTVELMTLAKDLGANPNHAIQDIARTRNTSLQAIGGLILFWLAAECEGLQPDVVTVVEKRGEGVTDWVKSLRTLPNRIKRVIRSVAASKEFNKEFKWITDQNNRPKVWLRFQIPPMTDQPRLSLSIGRSDFRNSKALEWAFTHQVNFKNESLTLREVYERGLLKLHEDLFGLVAATIVMLTSDNYIVVGQRGRLSWAKGRYSISCEEGWDPNKDSNPHETVLRCLAEEWHLDVQHNVEVVPEHVRLVAIGREWGHYWNTVLVYVVDLPCSSDVVINNWMGFPIDACEATGIGAIPIKSSKQRRLLLKLLTTEEVRWRNFKGAKLAGVVSDGKLHETTGAARVLFALAHRFGVKKIAADVEKMAPAKRA